MYNIYTLHQMFTSKEIDGESHYFTFPVLIFRFLTLIALINLQMLFHRMRV